MDIGIYYATWGCQAQGRRFDIIANNLANVNTTGFKKDVVRFDEALQEAVATDLRQGDTKQTGNPLDLALEGDGFFEVKTQGGTRYTRSGNFSLNADGFLVTQGGDPVMGANGPIPINGNDVEIDTEGQVTVDGAVVDTLSVVTFAQPGGLRKEGFSSFANDLNQRPNKDPEEIVVKQGCLEESNVVVVEEMTRMIEALRSYESYQKVLQTFDETTHKSVNEVGRVQ